MLRSVFYFSSEIFFDPPSSRSIKVLLPRQLEAKQRAGPSWNQLSFWNAIKRKKVSRERELLLWYLRKTFVLEYLLTRHEKAEKAWRNTRFGRSDAEFVPLLEEHPRFEAITAQLLSRNFETASKRTIKKHKDDDDSLISSGYLRRCKTSQKVPLRPLSQGDLDNNLLKVRTWVRF